MHPVQAHDLARALTAQRAPVRRRPRRAPARVRTALGRGLIVAGWRLVDAGRPRPA